MKKIVFQILLSILLLGAGFSLCAQQTNDRLDHIARDGDILHPGLSRSTELILAIIDSTKTVALNPQSISFDDSYDSASYVDGDTISYVQSATKHRFILHADTLSYLGFENRATLFSPDSAVNVARFPLKDGDTVHDKWTGHILHHGSLLLKRMAGTSASRTEKGWTLTDGTDTVRNATRLVWTLDMSYADPDSIDTALPDSIASSLISDMQVEVKSLLSERLVTERSLWFAEDARYPVLTDSRVSRVIYSPGSEKPDTVPVSMLAMYYPASFQYADTGEEPPAKPSRQTRSADDPSFDSDSIQESPLTIGEPSVSGNTLTVQLSSTSATDATLTTFTDSGIPLTDPVTVSIGPVPKTFTIAIPSGWGGIVLMRVETEDGSHTQKVII